MANFLYLDPKKTQMLRRLSPKHWLESDLKGQEKNSYFFPEPEGSEMDNFDFKRIVLLDTPTQRKQLPEWRSQ